ncbi:MAG: hypothetical protein KM310_11630 [Clostridiales bacterium]|nr:hypothetical protein [Clostridiales bacterium]
MVVPSGSCAAMVRSYPDLLRGDPLEAEARELAPEKTAAKTFPPWSGGR